MSTPEERKAQIEQLRQTPAAVEAVVTGLSDEDLYTHYVEGEWNVAQNVHHLADAHMEAFLRMKRMVSQDKPTVQPYNPDDWAYLPDANNLPIQDSLALLKSLHVRWCILLESLQDTDWLRVGIHPLRGEVTVESHLAIYSRHGDAHIQQIKETLAAKG